MSGLRVLDGKAFLDRDFDAVKLPARWMAGTCGGSTPRQVDGSKFIPRIFTDVPPELTEAGIDELRQSALEGLQALPELRNGLSRSAMGQLINEDIDALAALCHRYGTFGAAALPGAFDAITGLCVKAQTGNEHEVFVETDEHFYFFSLFTS